MSSIYVHIPFCINKCIFCGFPTYSLGRNYQSLLPHYTDLYLTHLKKEISNSPPPANKGGVNTIYIGGGTPSLLGADKLREIIRRIVDIYGDKPQENTPIREITLESTPNPSLLTPSTLQIYKDLGITRISLGIQSFSPLILNTLGRPHTIYNIYKSLDQVIGVFGEEGTSMDLMFGINEDMGMLEEDLRLAVDTMVPHISAYQLTLERGTKLYQNNIYTKSSGILDEEILGDQFEVVDNILGDGGYSHYEISSYSKGDRYQCVHNKVYWRGDEEWAAFGMGAASYISPWRVHRPHTITQYARFVQELGEHNPPNHQYYSYQTPLDLVKNVIIMRLRTSFGLSLTYLYHLLQRVFSDHVAISVIHRVKEFLSEIQEEGLCQLFVREGEDMVSLTSVKGFLLTDRICLHLLMLIPDV